MVILVGLDQSGGGRGYISRTRPKWGVDVVILVGLDQSGDGRGYIRECYDTPYIGLIPVSRLRHKKIHHLYLS